jgi:hypothetical protein
MNNNSVIPFTGMVNTTNDDPKSNGYFGCNAIVAYAIYIKDGVLDLKGYEYNNPREGGFAHYGSDYKNTLREAEKEYPGFLDKINAKLIVPIEL